MNEFLRSLSLPARGAWVEMRRRCSRRRAQTRSLPARGAWVEIAAGAGAQPRPVSLPARGAWVEITSRATRGGRSVSLPARGAWVEIRPRSCSVSWRTSLPARGAWVEIPHLLHHERLRLERRSPHGERGLKFRRLASGPGRERGRSPHGERGLKSRLLTVRHRHRPVAPRTGSVG